MRFAMASAATSVDHDINRSKALKFSRFGDRRRWMLS
jgi:hypothetical protein